MVTTVSTANIVSRGIVLNSHYIAAVLITVAVFMTIALFPLLRMYYASSHIYCLQLCFQICTMITLIHANPNLVSMEEHV